MNAPTHHTEDLAIEALLSEIERYLAAVDAFRAEGCNPRWRPEPVTCAVESES
jgi:hypothetical protein